MTTLTEIGEQSSCENCRCEMSGPASPLLVEAEIENRIFRDVRELLAKSADVKLSNPFHFHVLDSHRQQAVSRGHALHEGLMEEAVAFETCIRKAALAVAGSENVVQIGDVLAALNQNGRLMPQAKGFASFIAIAGQPLVGEPTRLEQFLAIRTAAADGFERVSESIRPIRNCSIYVIDNYLQPNDELDSVYADAKRHLGESAALLNDSGAHRTQPGAICTIDTAPFLAAEHLQMFELSGQPYTEWLKELSSRSLGLAFLPLRVLGQYRASGVWLYQGKFEDADNDNLRRHLEAIASTGAAHNAEAWLAPAISHAMLAASSVLLLRALSQFNDLLRTPLWKCELALRAISNLWYTKRIGLTHDKNVVRAGGFDLRTPPHSSWKRSEGSRTVQIILRVTYDPDISRVLGFDTIGFECPYVPRRDSDLDDEVTRAERVFSDIGSPVMAVRQRALLRQNEEIRRTLDLSAHDYANSLNDLISVTAGGHNSLVADIDPSAQLLLANSVAKGLLGYAWVQRMSSASAEEQRRADDGRLVIPFIESDPTVAEIEYWRRSFLQEAVYLAYSGFAHAWRMASARVTPTLRYRFWSPISDNGRASDKPFGEFSIGPQTLLSTYSVIDDEQPPWPIPPTVTAQKLGIDGQRAIMMWGARELIRNACRVTWQYAAAQECDPWISVDASINRDDEGHWQFRVAVTNPWPPQDPPKPYLSIKSNQTIERSISQAKFEDAHAPNIAGYVYYLRIRNDARP